VTLARRYAERALADRPRPAQRVRLTQTGEMQLKPGRWSRFDAVEDVRTDAVEFSWRATFRFAPLLSVRVHDWYRHGEGGLTGRLFGIVPVARAAGEETARAEAMRYLAELPWYPQAIVANPRLSWRALDDHAVEVATSVCSTRAAATLSFNRAGDLVGASASGRPRQENGRTVERPWSGEFCDFEVIGGVRIPTRAEVSWELPDGVFTYFRCRITGLELLDQ
jgi:hypothetical protein